MENTEFIQDGFIFYSQKEAETAASEKRKIEYLEAHIDYSRPESVLRIYERAIRERIFSTPVGMYYLRHLQNFLLEQPQIEKETVPPVPVYAVFNGASQTRVTPVRNRIQPEVKKEKFPALQVSVIVNIALVIAVIAMFVITLQSDQPNIINYERTITDRYAGWEQELTERERKVREKEKEFSIKPDITEDISE